MPENIRVIVYQFSEDVKRILGDKLTKIIVYGSYARGDYREDSDVDIMILTKLSEEEIRAIKNDIYYKRRGREIRPRLLSTFILQNIFQ